MNITRRTVLTGAAATAVLVSFGFLPGAAATTLTDASGGLPEDGVLTVHTISGKIKRFRIVEETYLDAYEDECVRHVIEPV